MSKKKGLNVSKVEEILDNEVVKDILNKKEEVEDMNTEEYGNERTSNTRYKRSTSKRNI